MAGMGRCRRCGQTIFWGANPSHPERPFPFDDPESQRSHFDTCSGYERVWDASGSTHAVWNCRACGERVWWTVVEGGARRPFDVEGDRATARMHFDTCRGQPADARVNQEPPPPREPSSPRDNARERRQAAAAASAPYEVRLWLPELGLDWPCTHADLVSRFRQLALKHHPDMGGNASDFIRIRNAYDRLCQLIPDQVAVA